MHRGMWLMLTFLEICTKIAYLHFSAIFCEILGVVLMIMHLLINELPDLKSR